MMTEGMWIFSAIVAGWVGLLYWMAYEVQRCGVACFDSNLGVVFSAWIGISGGIALGYFCFWDSL